MGTGSKTDARRARLLPEGVPRYVHCYDDGGKTCDRYTVVFTGRYRHKTSGECLYLGASSAPFHPQGFGQHGSSPSSIDSPRYAHLGKKVPFTALPEDVRKLALASYRDLWDLPT